MLTAVRFRPAVIFGAVVLTLLAGRLDAAEDTDVSPDGVRDPAPAAAVATEPPPGTDDWEFVAIPYIWGISINGNATVEGVKASIDASLGDILEKLNIAATGQFEVRKGPFGAFITPYYASLSSKNSIGPLSVKSTGKLFEMDFGVYYRVGEWELGDATLDAAPKVAVEPYIGGRLWSIDAKLKIKNFRSFSDAETWVDPIVGVRTLWDITSNWNLVVQGDVGGFGVASDLTWQALGLVGYRFGLFSDDDANVLVGYRALYDDYSTGSTSDKLTGEKRDKFALDATLHGPILGLAVKF